MHMRSYEESEYQMNAAVERHQKGIEKATTTHISVSLSNLAHLTLQ